MYRLRRKIAKAVIYERDPDYSSSMANGSFRLRIWEDDGEAKSLDPLPLGPPIREVKAPNLDFPHTNGELRTQMGQSIGRSDNVVLIADASISAFGETPIILRARADDGVRVFVNDQLVINRPSTHSFGVDLVSDLIQLRPGPNRFRVEYFEWGGPAGLLVEWRPINEESYKVLTAAQALP
jgi:hypothetical protein